MTFFSCPLPAVPFWFSPIETSLTLTFQDLKWETYFLPLLVLARRGTRGAIPVKISTGNNFLDHTTKFWRRFCPSVLYWYFLRSNQRGRDKIQLVFLLNWETDFYTVVVLTFFWKSLLQNFQSQCQWCTKILLPWAQKFYTPLVLGRESKCPWQFSPPAVVVYKIFSLRSSRSSSVIFFLIFRRESRKNLIIVGNLEGIFRGFFLTHRTKAQKFRGKFRSIFRTKIRGSKKIFRAKFTLQTCHLNKILLPINCVKTVENVQLNFSKFQISVTCRSQTCRGGSLVHHNAATQNAAMHNASFSQRYPYPFFYSVIAVMPCPVFQHRP